MCGLTGFTGQPDQVLLRRMSTRLAHRGPDVSGAYEDEGISLSCERLRIRDPSPEADQPYQDAQGRVIVFNGELFNHSALRDTLITRGHSFRTNCDTETLLASYAEWGTGCFSRLDGMFAVAIWDPGSRKLVLSRDLHGIKPLYYLMKGPDLFFASELKALLAVPGLPRHLDPQALAGYLAFGCNPYGQSLIQGIRRVPPGTVLAWRLGGSVSLAPFSLRGMAAPLPERALLSAIRASFLAATGDLAEADLYLSGGVDSALLLALLSEQGTFSAIRTYTAAFPEHDESSAAVDLAAHFGSTHRSVPVEAKHLALLPDIVWYADEALSDPAALPMFLLSREAARHSRVVLTGDGADELFLGYEQFRMLLMHRKLLTPWPDAIRREAAGALALVPRRGLDKVFPYMSALGDQGIERAARFVRLVDPLEQYLEMVSLFTPQERKQLGSEMALRFDEFDTSESRRLSPPVMERIAHLDSALHFAHGMLAKTDRMTMAHSVEARLPYLSSGVIRAASSCPTDKKISLFRDKICLRRAARQVLPRRLLPATKHRFFVPLHAMWPKELSDLLDAAVGSDAVQVLGFRRAYLRSLSERLSKSPLYIARQMWNLLSLLLWVEMFILGDGDRVLRPRWWSI